MPGFRDSNPDKEYDAWVDRHELRHRRILRAGMGTSSYRPPPRRRLRYWLKTIWRLIVPGGISNG